MNDKQLWVYIRPIVSISYSAKLAKQKNTAVKESGAKYFSSEFNGATKVKGRELSESYVYHGIIVDSLKQYAENLHPLALVFNTQKIDLAIEVSNEISHIFEVKTSADSQSVYTAVGQVLMHSVGLNNAEKVVVLPKNNENVEVAKCLNELGIYLWLYTICDDKVVFEPQKA
jgi:predicted Zn-dependent protease